MTHLNKTLLLTFAISNLQVLAVNSAFADDDNPGQMELIAKTAGLISAEQATQKALAAKPGTVIEMELDDRKFPQGWDYEFEIIDAQGQEWDVDIDAKTGEARKVSRDWF